MAVADVDYVFVDADDDEQVVIEFHQMVGHCCDRCCYGKVDPIPDMTVEAVTGLCYADDLSQSKFI